MGRNGEGFGSSPGRDMDWSDVRGGNKMGHNGGGHRLLHIGLGEALVYKFRPSL